VRQTFSNWKKRKRRGGRRGTFHLFYIIHFNLFILTASCGKRKKKILEKKKPKNRNVGFLRKKNEKVRRKKN
jgi:hypothetical protein